jgi:TolA-binding protein
MEKWEDAFGGYSSLHASASIQNNKTTALKGMMRSAYRWHNWAEAIKAAEDILYDGTFADEVRREASYVKAKALMATSRRAEATAVFDTLAGDVSDAYGAEAAYMLIQDCYDKGDFAAVEEKVSAFGQAGSRQVYWLAKSFIVLGDSFVDLNNLTQARATFESIRDGYTPMREGDDIMDNLRIRLTKLEEMISQQN